MALMQGMVMTMVRHLRPGDVLHGGELVVRMDELRNGTQHMTVIDATGKVKRVAYGCAFVLMRQTREEE
jgi:hypothetical protein